MERKRGGPPLLSFNTAFMEKMLAGKMQLDDLMPGITISTVIKASKSHMVCFKRQHCQGREGRRGGREEWRVGGGREGERKEATSVF